MSSETESNSSTKPQQGAEAEATRVELLSRGDLVLQQLDQAAIAARAEAKRAELEILLADARGGNTEPLQQWLLKHKENEDGGAGGRDSNLRSHLDHSETDTRLGLSSSAKDVSDDRSPNCVVTGQGGESRWEPFLRHARGRLTARANATSEVVRGRALDPIATKRRQDALKVVARTTHATISENQEERKKAFFFARFRGAVASLLVHIGLVVSLAVVTLKMPSPPAGMAFESASAESVEQMLEMTQPVELETPDAVAEPTRMPEPAFDATESLAEVSSAISTDLGSLAPAPSNRLAGVTAASSIATATASSAASNASFFGAAAGGNCFCYVIDGSGSMRNGPWDAAKLELWKSLASLKPNQRFYIIFFNRELSAITVPGEREPAERPLYATKENLEHARRWMDTLRIDIGAPPTKALSLAIEKEPDAVYLLTDGVTKVDVAEFLERENRISDLINGQQVRVPIHTIAFYSLEGQQLLKQIAAENKGQFIYVPDPRRR